MTITRIAISLVFLGLTLFSAVTHAQRAKDVIIINDANNPVPVTTNGFVRTPFAIQLDGQTGTPSDEECPVSFNVPNDQLLVIEGFSILSRDVGVTETTVRVFTNGADVTHFYPRQQNATNKLASHHVRLYADPGSAVNFLMTSATSDVTSRPCTFAVSGYLIDPSSPP
ncbi:MAG: hypothetical protein V3T19_02870 [Acidiferrobacterales bacterium]|jgi:hypothetical protein